MRRNLARVGWAAILFVGLLAAMRLLVVYVVTEPAYCDVVVSSYAASSPQGKMVVLRKTSRDSPVFGAPYYWLIYLKDEFGNETLLAKGEENDSPLVYWTRGNEFSEYGFSDQSKVVVHQQSLGRKVSPQAYAAMRGFVAYEFALGPGFLHRIVGGC
jgi:hypothetical protein